MHLWKWLTSLFRSQKPVVHSQTLVLPTQKPAPRLVKVSLLDSGEIQVDGKPCTLGKLAAALKNAAATDGLVWYYREENYPNPMKAFSIILRLGLPFALSKNAEFTSFLNEQELKQLSAEWN